MRRRAAGVLAPLLLAAAPAATQTPSPDAIDAILGQPAPPAPTEPAEASPRYVPPPPRLSSPVFVHETGRNPDGPATAADLAYDGRLRSSAASAQGFHGPLDGGWTLAAGGRDLFVLQLTDRNGVLEGAWRDLRRPGALDASGFVDQAERAGPDVTLRFSGAVAVLRAVETGWTGELTEAGRTEPVRLTRRNP